MLPMAGNVVIRIFNAQGQQVVSYYKQHDSSGHFSIVIDARSYAGGIYFYTLEVNGHYEVKKMMLLK